MKEEYTNTGNYIFDQILSNSLFKGGIPKDKILSIYGQPGVGKSMWSQKQSQLYEEYNLRMQKELRQKKLDSL